MISPMDLTLATIIALLAALGGGAGFGHFRIPSFRRFVPRHGTSVLSPFGPFRGGTPWYPTQPWTPLQQSHFSHASGVLVLVLAVLLGFVLLWALIALAAHSIGVPAVLLGIQKDMETGGRALSVGEIYAAAKPYFWRVVGFSVLWFVVFVVMLMLVMLPFSLLLFSAGGRLSVMVLCVWPLIGVLVILMWLLGILLELSLLALVLENRKVFNAINRGWQLFKAHFWHWILTSVLLEAVRFIVGLAVALPSAVLGIGSFAAVLLAIFTRTLSPTARFSLGIGGLLALAVVVIFGWLVSAALVIYTQGGWVSAYNQLVSQKFSQGEQLISPAE